MMMIARVVLGTCWLIMGVVSMWAAEWEDPPIIIPVEASRVVAVGVDTESTNDDFEEESSAGGPFVKTIGFQAIGDWGSTSDVEAKQQTQLSIFSVRGSGSVVSETSLGSSDQASVEAYASSSVNLRFTVPVDSAYSLSGTLEASGVVDGICLGWSLATLSGERADGSGFSDSAVFNCNSDPMDKDFFFSGGAKANATLTLNVYAQSATFGDEGADMLGTGWSSFDFVLDFGDRDGDGLLDVWEEEGGIDFPGAGLEIDLSGADPDHKDLFVEIDTMATEPIDTFALAMVADVFAHAPADLIDNPDGAPGINLHLIYEDGDVIPHSPIQGTRAEINSEASAIKSAYFGTPQNRAHPQSEEILEVRSFVYRYCMWVDTLIDDVGHMGGLGEIPGNDFLVAAGHLRDKGLGRATDWLAATLMHELGHTLALKHGGKDHINYKPNYLSIMNYIYVVPLPNVSAEGTRVSEIWRLAFSQSPLPTIDESSLDESIGLLGPIGRRIMFNFAAPTDPDPTVLTLAWAWEPVVDWNHNGTVPDFAPYQQDINRFRSVHPVNYQVLESASDWDRL